MKQSTDVWFCAYLINKGLVIKEYSVIARGKISCRFDISDNDWQKYKLEFHNSEISKFKSIIDKLKDLAYVFGFIYLTSSILCTSATNLIV